MARLAAAFPFPERGTLYKTGHSFGGWNDGSITYAEGETYSMPAPPVTFTAQWTPNPYTVSYEDVADFTEPDSSSGTFPTPVNITSDIPTKDGYTFLCWNTAANGTGESYPAGASFKPTEDATLYAQWIKDSLTGIAPVQSLTAQDVVYFGTYGAFAWDTWRGDPMAWRVLDADADNAGGLGSMFLVTENVMSKFGARDNGGVECDEQETWFTPFLNNAFSDAERNAISAVSKTDGRGAMTAADAWDGNASAVYDYASTLTNEKVFSLSVAELFNTAYFADASARTALSADGQTLGAWYLTRSSDGENAAVVATNDTNTNRIMADWITFPSYGEIPVRPATNLSRETLAWLTPTETLHEYKLTLRGDRRFTAGTTASGVSGGSASVSHQALAAPYTTVYAEIRDGANIISAQYITGEINDRSSALDLTGIAAGDYTVLLYGVQKGSGSATDVISKPSSPVALTVTTPYTASFDLNGAPGTAPAALPGNTITLPAAPARDGFSFTVWSTAPNGDGDSVTAGGTYTLTDNTIFYAQWTENPVVSGDINDPSSPSIYTAVTAKLVPLGGGAEIPAVVSGAAPDWQYIVSAPAGEYDLVVEARDGMNTVTVTSLISVSATMAQDIVLPAGSRNSLVDNTAAGALPSLVGGLDTIADEYLFETGETGVEIKLSVTGYDNEAGAATEHTDAVSGIKALTGSRTVEYIDLSLTKRTNADPAPVDIGESNDELLTILIPFTTTDKKHIAVYRYHSGTAAPIPQGETNKNADGEYFTIAPDCITVYAKKFSLYAISYTVPFRPGIGTAGCTITVSAADGGAISPSGRVSVTRGGSKTFAIIADNGYRIADVLVDGKSVGAVSSYTFNKVTGSHTISAKFVKCESVADPNTTGVSKLLETDAHIAYLSGYADGNFGPSDNMTRAQAAQMFYNLLRNKAVAAEADYSDIPDDAWYAQAVNTLSALGIIEGVGNKQYAPERPITRAEFIVVAMRFATLDTSGVNCFSDVSESDWFCPQVKGAIKYGWIDGYSDGTFRPYATITRAEVTAIVNRLLGRSADPAYLNSHAAALRSFPDVFTSYWAYEAICEATNTHHYTITEGAEVWTGSL